MEKIDPRHIWRERALNLLYEAELKAIDCSQLLEELPLMPDDYVVEILKGVEKDILTLNELIARHSKDWALDRMPATDRAIIRMAGYELKNTDVPTAVIINEAVELSKEYSTEHSGRFVNGVLASLVKELRPES